MAVVVPATDTGNVALQTQIAAVQALVNAPTINPATLAANIALLDQLQQQLVSSLMANAARRNGRGAGNSSNQTPSFLTASGIISAGTINT